jgi:hypothetical protein
LPGGGSLDTSPGYRPRECCLKSPCTCFCVVCGGTSLLEFVLGLLVEPTSTALYRHPDEPHRSHRIQHDIRNEIPENKHTLRSFRSLDLHISRWLVTRKELATMNRTGTMAVNCPCTLLRSLPQSMCSTTSWTWINAKSGVFNPCDAAAVCLRLPGTPPTCSCYQDTPGFWCPTPLASL